MNWVALGGSLAAVLSLGGVAAWLRLGGPERSFLEPGEAMRAAEEAIAGFVATAAGIGSDGRAALVVGKGLRVVILKAHGARVAAREIRWDMIRATPAGMLVETGERRFGAVLLSEVDNLDVRRLAPQLTQV